MTSQTRSTEAGSVSRATTRRKAALSCPRCGHTNPVDGDWLRCFRPAGTEIRCPECDERLTVRPQLENER